MQSGVGFRRSSLEMAENILISLASNLLKCEVLSLGLWFLMCWAAVPSKHGSPHA